jgi:hypothetical protein
MDDLGWMVPRLTSALAALNPGEHLIISRLSADRYVSGRGPNRYVQFARFGDQIRLESVGERYLAMEDGLSELQARALGQLGFNDPDKGGNHWLHLDVPAKLAEAASLALTTLATVHGVDYSEQLDFSGPPAALEALGGVDGDDIGVQAGGAWRR